MSVIEQGKPVQLIFRYGNDDQTVINAVVTDWSLHTSVKVDKWFSSYRDFEVTLHMVEETDEYPAVPEHLKSC